MSVVVVVVVVEVATTLWAAVASFEAATSLSSTSRKGRTRTSSPSSTPSFTLPSFKLLAPLRFPLPLSDGSICLIVDRHCCWFFLFDDCSHHESLFVFLSFVQSPTLMSKAKMAHSSGCPFSLIILAFFTSFFCTVPVFVIAVEKKKKKQDDDDER